MNWPRLIGIVLFVLVGSLTAWSIYDQVKAGAFIGCTHTQAK